MSARRLLHPLIAIAATILGGVATSVSLGAPDRGDATLQGEIRIAGSSTVGPITMAVADQFQEDYPSVRVSNAVTGTGGGFKKFVAGETDISNASRPIKPSEVDLAAANGVEFIELPVAFDGLTIAVGRSNHWCTDLTVDELKDIFLAGSTVERWSDIRTEWPDTPVELFIPGTDSGTFDYFKEVVAGKTGSIRDDVTVSEDDNVLVNGVSNTPGGLGFFGCAYYFQNRGKLRSIPISHEGGEPIPPTHDTIERGEYAPFSRPLFIYVNTRSAARPEVRAFVEFYMRNGGRIAEEVNYVQLPRTIYRQAFRSRFMLQETGTAYVNDESETVHPPLREQFN
ncbi:MAG: PstS family phosphate ABC transporter substrate-binding protein [Planctomycetota bacterium]